MEQRVSRLEDAMRDNTAAIARIDVAVAEIRATLPSMATKVEVAELRVDIAALNAKIDHQTETMHRYLATKEDIGELRGNARALPTTWVMVTAIVAGQIGITGVIAGALLAAARMFVHT
ncbi:MAG TPA: hypothetical protein VK741_01380 [Acetobacteraceae bacterium]|jgi:hypothetical protein|nr:hypothetical protein [Acetobacteraceae bacterium]